MGEEPKGTLTARASLDVIRRIDAIAEKQGRSRSEVVEKLVIMALQNEEEIMTMFEDPIQGKVAKLMMNPNVLKFLEAVSGDKVDWDQIKVGRHVIAQAEEGRKGRKVPKLTD